MKQHNTLIKKKKKSSMHGIKKKKERKALAGVALAPSYKNGWHNLA